MKSMNKYATFTKNVGLGCIGCIVGGIVGTELTDLVTDSKKLISICATISQYVSGYATLFTYHAKDNLDLYYDNNKFLKTKFIKDCGKIFVGMGALDYIYLLGRGYVHYYFQKEGYSPIEASLLTDFICLPAFCVASVPVAKITGIFRNQS